MLVVWYSGGYFELALFPPPNPFTSKCLPLQIWPGKRTLRRTECLGKDVARQISVEGTLRIYRSLHSFFFFLLNIITSSIVLYTSLFKFRSIILVPVTFFPFYSSVYF